jgi:phage/plasmid-associated DNA primase
MDVIGNFIRERCVQRPGAAVRTRELFQVYQDRCDENNEMATSERMFGLRLEELGMVQKRTSETVGPIALNLMERRKAGRADYAPLWRCGGGGGRTPP